MAQNRETINFFTIEYEYIYPMGEVKLSPPSWEAMLELEPSEEGIVTPRAFTEPQSLHTATEPSQGHN